MNHPEIAKIGLGNVDTARLKKSIDILVDANALAAHPPTRSSRALSCRRDRPNLREEAVSKFDMDLHDSKGRVAVITGPAKGMGAAITLAFAAEGARLALSAATPPRSNRSPSEARAKGGEAIVVPCDLTDAAQCEHARRSRRAAFGRIDILVNVAGGSGPIGKTGVETTPQEFDDIVDLNMNGCFHTMRGVLPTHDGAALRQDRQCRRHFRHARTRRAHGLFRVQMGPARHHQELRARGRPIQHQRQLRRAGHGRRPALSRQGLRRHGASASASPSRKRSSATPPTTRSSASRPMPTSPMPACSWRATSRARSPASTCRSMAAGRCCEEQAMRRCDDRRSRHPRRQGRVAGLASSMPASRSRTA